MASYIHLERLGDALGRIAGRFSRGDKFMRAVTEIEANYEALEKDFSHFSLISRGTAHNGSRRRAPGAVQMPVGFHCREFSEAWTGRAKGHSASVGREHTP
jgi:hypothetical protein